MSKAKSNPFLSTPFPANGGEYRFDGETLHQETPEAPAAPEAVDDAAAATDKTTAPAARRNSR